MANNTLAYGFSSLTQFLAERPSTVGMGVIERAIRDSSAEWSRQMDAMLSFFVQRTTMAQQRYLLPGSGTLQPVDEFGIPLPVRPSGHYDIAFPIQGGGTAYGRNRVTAALETVADINRDQLDAEMKDADWLRRHLLAALLDNATWTYADPLLGNLTVQPLANNDSVTYVGVGGAAATANHYRAQTAAIADATNPYSTIYSVLSSYVGNQGGKIVSFIPAALAATTQALATFVDVMDPLIRQGDTTATLVGDPGFFNDSIRGPGELVLGRTDNQWVVQWGAMPANTILSVVVGDGVERPLAMREYADPALQGFFPEMHSPDGARIERRYLRYAGFGALNRVSAMVYQVNNSDTVYDIPTGYDAPLAV